MKKVIQLFAKKIDMAQLTEARIKEELKKCINFKLPQHLTRTNKSLCK